MAKTRQITVGSVTAVEIKATSTTQEIVIGEYERVTNWPTTDLLIYKPDTSSDPRAIPAGVPYTFPKPNGSGRPFQNGESAGWVKTVSGTTTLFVDEPGY